MGDVNPEKTYRWPCSAAIFSAPGPERRRKETIRIMLGLMARTPAKSLCSADVRCKTRQKIGFGLERTAFTTTDRFRHLLFYANFTNSKAGAESG